MDMKQKKSAYINRLVQRTSDVLDALDAFTPLRKEWDELAYSDGPEAIIDEDLETEFPHLNKAKIIGLMTTIDALAFLRTQGHGTNLQNIRR